MMAMVCQFIGGCKIKNTIKSCGGNYLIFYSSRGFKHVGARDNLMFFLHTNLLLTSWLDLLATTLSFIFLKEGMADYDHLIKLKLVLLTSSCFIVLMLVRFGLYQYVSGFVNKDQSH